MSTNFQQEMLRCPGLLEGGVFSNVLLDYDDFISLGDMNLNLFNASRNSVRRPQTHIHHFFMNDLKLGLSELKNMSMIFFQICERFSELFDLALEVMSLNLPAHRNQRPQKP